MKRIKWPRREKLARWGTYAGGGAGYLDSYSLDEGVGCESCHGPGLTHVTNPDLKANQTMASLMEELPSTENKVAFARQAYNDSVMDYNNACEMFPSGTIANLFRFTPAAMLEIEDAAKRAVPKVSFN